MADTKAAQRMCYPHIIPQLEYIREDVVVYRFEDFDNSVKDICQRLDIDYKTIHEKKTGHKHYSEYYTPELINIIASVYKDDIERFNYKFECKVQSIATIPNSELNIPMDFKNNIEKRTTD